MKKGILLSALLAVMLFVGGLCAFNPTVWTDGKFTLLEVVTGLLDSTGTTRLTLGATNAFTGNLSVSGTFTPPLVSVGTFTVTGQQGVRLTGGQFITPAATVPAAAGILGLDSSYVLYISSGTGTGAWVKIGGQ